MDILFYNGSFLPAEKISIDPSDRGFLLGDGVFDTMLSVDGNPLHDHAHFTRLKTHADIMGIPAPTMDLPRIAADLLKRNGFIKGRHAIRTTLSRGPAPRGLAIPETVNPTLMMRAFPVPDPPATIQVAIARTVRRNEGSVLSRIKSLNYGDSVLAMREAKQSGADDAILLNNRGEVCCLTASNIMIMEGDTIITPPLSCGVLDGIERGLIISSGQARKDVITVERLKAADAVFCVNSIIGKVKVLIQS
jgi:branched-chain amino acid aminotransferase